MNQVHKENLTTVENALPNRQGLDVEIFGMEGVPEDIVQQHNQRIIQNFYTAQSDRFAATGNPPAGQSGNQGPRKKLKAETAEELKARLAQHRARATTQNAAGAGAVPGAAPGDGNSPAQGVSACVILTRADLRIMDADDLVLEFTLPLPPSLRRPGCSWFPTSADLPARIPAWSIAPSRGAWRIQPPGSATKRVATSIDLAPTAALWWFL